MTTMKLRQPKVGAMNDDRSRIGEAAGSPDQGEIQRIERLRRAWREGIESGDAGPLDFAGIREAALRDQSLALRIRAQSNQNVVPAKAGTQGH
jgi:hypothetical protein